MARLTDSKVMAIKPPERGQVEFPDDLVTGLRLRVGAGGRKAWIVRTRAGDKVLNKTLGSYPIMQLSKAREAAREFLQQLARDGAPKTEVSFGELVDEWVKKVAEPNNRSWKLQRRRLELHVLPHWKNRTLSSITRATVRDLVEGIEGDVNPNRVLALLRTLFRYALGRDWVAASPAEGISKPKIEKARERVLDMEEVRRVYLTSELLGYPFTGFVRMLLLTGQRRTEVAGMRWSDIDLEAATWTLPAEQTKSSRAHLVPLSVMAVRLLEQTPRMGNYVWSLDGEAHILGYSKAKSRLDSFLAAQGDPLAPWVFHDIRRSVATHMVRLGVMESVVSRVLNHASQGVTARIYALHTYAPEKRSALDRWAQELARAIDGESSGNIVPLRRDAHE